MPLSDAMNRADDEDLFAHTRMSFGDHIEELRLRLLRALVGFFVALVAGLFLGQPMLAFIQKPVQDQLSVILNERVEKEKAKLDQQVADEKKAAEEAGQGYMAGPEISVQMFDESKQAWVTSLMRLNVDQLTILQQKYQQIINHRTGLITLTVMEAFMTYFLVSIYCGIVLSSPWLFYQAWMFISAGLYPQEKKYVYVYLPLSLGLFLGGVALCEFVVLPLGVHYLLSFNEWLSVEPELRLSDWLNFAIMMPLIFGASFQTPIVMLFLERMGIVEVTLYTKNRRMAYFALAAIGALMAAAPDALNMMLLVVPLWGLFEFGILLCRFAPKSASDMDEPDPDEMVEG
jgi:sec-independent protein translocase protein TatC